MDQYFNCGFQQLEVNTRQFSTSLQNKWTITRISQIRVRLHHLFSIINVKFRSFFMHIHMLHEGIITKINQTGVRLHHLFCTINIKFRTFFMHIHTHVACNAQDLNFKFKLKLGRVKLTQVLVPAFIISRTKIKFLCESLSTSNF